MKEADNLESVFFFFISAFLKGEFLIFRAIFITENWRRIFPNFKEFLTRSVWLLKTQDHFFPKRLLFFLTRFLTIDYKEEYYTREGLDWVESSTMKDILLRNFPEVSGLDKAMKNITNAFYVWSQ